MVASRTGICSSSYENFTCFIQSHFAGDYVFLARELLLHPGYPSYNKVRGGFCFGFFLGKLFYLFEFSGCRTDCCFFSPDMFVERLTESSEAWREHVCIVRWTSGKVHKAGTIFARTTESSKTIILTMLLSPKVRFKDCSESNLKQLSENGFPGWLICQGW